MEKEKKKTFPTEKKCKKFISTVLCFYEKEDEKEGVILCHGETQKITTLFFSQK